MIYLLFIFNILLLIEFLGLVEWAEINFTFIFNSWVYLYFLCKLGLLLNWAGLFYLAVIYLERWIGFKIYSSEMKGPDQISFLLLNRDLQPALDLFQIRS
jgi:hypothetical protein